MKAVLRWVVSNLPSMVLALLLSALAWFVAVESEDPTRTDRYPQAIAVQTDGLAEGIVVLGSPSPAVRVELRTTELIWSTLTPEDFTATVDMVGLGPGTHTLPVEVTVAKQPARIILVDPAYVTLELDAQTELTVPVRVEVEGEPALGYLQRTASIAPREVGVSGPETYVSQVAEAFAQVSVQDATVNVEGTFPLRLLDTDGASVPYVVAAPATVDVRIPIELSGYYRPLPVKVVITGQVALNYRVTGITVEPPTVTVFGPPETIAELPGYVQTQPIDVEGAVADIVERPALDLPSNTSVVLGQQPIVVRVLVEAIQSSRTVQITPTLQGLDPAYTATVPLDTIEVILSGPLPLLEALEPGDVRVVLNLYGLTIGTHQIEPQVVAPEGIVVQNVLPTALQIEIAVPVSPTETPVVTPAVPLPATPAGDVALTPAVSPTPSETPAPE